MSSWSARDYSGNAARRPCVPERKASRALAATVGATSNDLELGFEHGLSPFRIDGRRKLGAVQARDGAAILAREVRMDVRCGFAIGVQFVARDASRAARDLSEADLDELLQVAEERRAIPIVVAERLDDFTMRERMRRAREQLEHGDAWRRHAQTFFVNETTDFLARQRRHDGRNLAARIADAS